MIMTREIPAAALEEAAKLTEQLINQGFVPGLGVLRVGTLPEHIALEDELAAKARTMGILIEKFIMSDQSDEEDVIDVINFLNTDGRLQALVMPGPLPEHMDEANVRGFLGDAGKAISGTADELLYMTASMAAIAEARYREEEE